MTVDRRQEVERLFEAAVERDGAARAAYLDAACSGDAELRRHVSTLLDADASPSWLDAGPERLATSLLDDTPAAELIGSDIGPYRLIAMLGAGGSGVVFLAERNDIGSTVALKLLRDAWVSPTRRGRFVEEQRTLARLSHPCIARIFDAGGEDGRVWFAMECVEGLPLDEYLRRRRLPLAEALRLLRRICGAVQYAHERLVVHRDLKPSNILVLADGTPKLVDFGIAMNLERPGDHYAGPVRFLTPAYAAPEEVRGESLGVPADVYSLGTILGELLQSNLPDRIGRSRRADLVAIAAKAAHPEPASRYATVEGLDRDLGAFLAGFPVSARPLGALPRAGRFIARHRRRVIALGLAAVSLIGVASYYGVRLATARAETRAEASRSDRLLKFVLSLFEGGTAGGAPPADLRVVSLLERGVREADGLSADPPARAELLETLGQIYLELGDLDRADGLLRGGADDPPRGSGSATRCRRHVCSRSPTSGSPRHVSTTPSSCCARPARWATGCSPRPIPIGSGATRLRAGCGATAAITRRRPPASRRRRRDTRRHRRWPPNMPRRWLRSPSRTSTPGGSTMPSAPTARRWP